MSAMQIHSTIQQANIFQTMFEELPVGVAVTDNRGIVVYTNKEFSVLTGCDPNELNAKPIDTILHSERQHNDILATIPRHSEENKFELNDRYFLRKGRRLHITVAINKVTPFYCFTIRNFNQQAQNAEDQNIHNYTQLHNSNISLKEKNEQLIQANNDLSRSNQDLSEYAYVASHDLQEPLRKIRIFSDMLLGSTQIVAKDRFLASKINSAAERMNVMIRDLLNYSKVLKSDIVFETVDLSEIAKAVLSDFEVSIQETRAEITIGKLPLIDAVKLQMNQLFYNLLGNALKFTAPGQAPVIEISVNDLSNKDVRRYIRKPDPAVQYLLIRFADHGIGFDIKDAEQIFEVFKRLYTRETYQGSGIGLALCRRIVLNHGGGLFAESEPGKGSTFNIILPKEHPGTGTREKA